MVQAAGQGRQQEQRNPQSMPLPTPSLQQQSGRRFGQPIYGDCCTKHVIYLLTSFSKCDVSCNNPKCSL